MLSLGSAFTQTIPIEIDFRMVPEGSGYRFEPILPALSQRAGAPVAFWTLHWNFGDGHRSREQNPLHHYQMDGQYDPILLATGNYDTGDTPDKKKKEANINRFCFS